MPRGSGTALCRLPRGPCREPIRARAVRVVQRASSHDPTDGSALVSAGYAQSHGSRRPSSPPIDGNPFGVSETLFGVVVNQPFMFS